MARNRQQKRQYEIILQQQAMQNPSFFYYKGDVPNLQRRLDEVMARGIPITDAYIVLSGIEVHSFSMGLLLLTIFLGAFFIFPLFFMCYDCWKSSVYPVYDVPIELYQKLQVIFCSPTIRTIQMDVCDNNFGAQKAKVFFGMLSRSTTKSFNFANGAVHMDYKESEYSNFVENMKPIKMLPFVSVMRWWTQIVL